MIENVFGKSEMLELFCINENILLLNYLQGTVNGIYLLKKICWGNLQTIENTKPVFDK